jgi:hypothetical protein
MGWFKKKSDPITERARSLNDQIAQLERQIAELSGKMQEVPAEEPPLVQEPEVVRAKELPPAAASQAAQPRLRSTALPRSQGVVVHGATPPLPTAAPEPVFEDVAANPFKNGGEPHIDEVQPDLGVRKNGLGSLVRRLSAHFRGPPTTNPKLVNYLAAGSIQGLRPLRYEKRVARNRVIVLVFVLVLILWGILSVILRRP